MILYIPNVSLVNDNVYTKFRQILSIHSQDIEQKLNSDVNLCKFAKNTNVDLINDNVYTKFGLSKSIRSQDIEQKLNYDINQGL